VSAPVPAVSVLIPAFDAQATLGAALRSVARQTLAELECWVVDDGSTDGTRAVAEAFAARDARFHVLARPHQGLVASLQAGLERCSAPYVARLDADDLMHRRRLELQAAALNQAPELSGVGCHVRLFPRASLSGGLRRYEAWLNALDSAEAVARDALIESPLAHPTFFFRREALCELGYRDVEWPEDYDLILRALASGHRLGVLPRRLVSWRDHPARLSRTDPRCGLDRFPRLRAHHLARTFLAGHERYILWGYGDTGRVLARELRACGKQASHIVELHPGRLGNRIHGAPVIPPEALAALGPARIVVSVAGAKARGEIRARMGELGFVEGRDFVCAA
jgi:glycosyltransferase involved in cell wall biosynthesis